MLTFFTKREIVLNQERLKSRRNFSDFDGLSNITIVFELADYKSCMEIKSTLSSINCSVQLIGYIADPKKNNEEITGYLFSTKDVNFVGKPKSDVVLEFNERTKGCNLIIDTTRGEFLPINYLLSQKNDVFKVGLAPSSIILYDFILELSKNVDTKFLCEQILFYLRKLKSKRPKIVP